MMVIGNLTEVVTLQGGKKTHYGEVMRRNHDPMTHAYEAGRKGQNGSTSPIKYWPAGRNCKWEAGQSVSSYRL